MATIRELIGRQQAKRVREAHEKGGNVELTRKHLKFKMDDVIEGADGMVRFSGYANVATVDRTGDVIPPDAWRKAINGFMDYGPILYFMHDWGMPIGRITDAKVTDQGLWVEGGIEKNESPDTGQPITHPLAQVLDYARMAVKKGLMQALSVGIRVYETGEEKRRDDYLGEERKVRVLKRVELLEISLVTIPASREAVIAAKHALNHSYGQEWADALADPEPSDPPSNMGQLILNRLEALSKSTNGSNDDEAPAIKLVSLRDDPQPTQFKLTNLRGE